MADHADGVEALLVVVVEHARQGAAEPRVADVELAVGTLDADRHAVIGAQRAADALVEVGGAADDGAKHVPGEQRRVDVLEHGRGQAVGGGRAVDDDGAAAADRLGMDLQVGLARVVALAEAHLGAHGDAAEIAGQHQRALEVGELDRSGADDGLQVGGDALSDGVADADDLQRVDVAFLHQQDGGAALRPGHDVDAREEVAVLAVGQLDRLGDLDGGGAALGVQYVGESVVPGRDRIVLRHAPDLDPGIADQRAVEHDGRLGAVLRNGRCDRQSRGDGESTQGAENLSHDGLRWRGAR